MVTNEPTFSLGLFVLIFGLIFHLSCIIISNIQFQYTRIHAGFRVNVHTNLITLVIKISAP